ncbi:TetR/AcrR family transcriptional regulator [Actinomadura napierensis]|uniref:HTH tetR-type domain-containing protein n=1 Tax=Actinomadura napierensis TaxID=267854 RepID=A0ABN2Z6K0_9ACTN
MQRGIVLPIAARGVRVRDHDDAQAESGRVPRRGDAVRRLLVEAPAEPVSLDGVARLARVARSTIYTVFGSRTGLFVALGMDLLDRGGFAGMRQAFVQPDARQGMRDGIVLSARMYAAHRDVLRALYSMAHLDAEAVGAAVRLLEDGRAHGMDGLARRLHEAGALRDGVTAEQAGHTLWLLTGFDAFDALFTGRSLPADAVAAHLADVAERALCGPGSPAVPAAAAAGRPGAAGDEAQQPHDQDDGRDDPQDLQGEADPEQEQREEQDEDHEPGHRGAS